MPVEEVPAIRRTPQSAPSVRFDSGVSKVYMCRYQNEVVAYPDTLSLSSDRLTKSDCEGCCESLGQTLY